MTSHEKREVVGMSSNLDNLLSELDKIKRTVNELKQAYKQISALTSKLSTENMRQNFMFKELHQEVTDQNQYGRRESIEILNIKEDIHQNELEKYAIEFLKKINVSVTSYDIVAVHRLGWKKQGKNRSVVVRFINRKNAIMALKNKRKSREINNPDLKRLFVVENLCPVNKQLFNILYRMKKRNEINSVWSYNGNIFMKLYENSERVRIQSEDDINAQFYVNELGDEYDPYRSYNTENSGSNDEGSENGPENRSENVTSHSVAAASEPVQPNDGSITASMGDVLRVIDSRVENSPFPPSLVTDNRVRRSRSASAGGDDRRSAVLFG